MISCDEINFCDQSSLKTYEDDMHLSLKDGKVYLETISPKSTIDSKSKLREPYPTNIPSVIVLSEVDLIISYKNQQKLFV